VAGGIENKANSVQFPVKLPVGTELGNESFLGEPIPGRRDRSQEGRIGPRKVGLFFSENKYFKILFQFWFAYKNKCLFDVLEPSEQLYNFGENKMIN